MSKNHKTYGNLVWQHQTRSGDCRHWYAVIKPETTMHVGNSYFRSHLINTWTFNWSSGNCQEYPSQSKLVLNWAFHPVPIWAKTALKLRSMWESTADNPYVIHKKERRKKKEKDKEGSSREMALSTASCGASTWSPAAAQHRRRRRKLIRARKWADAGRRWRARARQHAIVRSGDSPHRQPRTQTHAQRLERISPSIPPWVPRHLVRCCFRWRGERGVVRIAALHWSVFL
jgi:hypothetical protein